VFLTQFQGGFSRFRLLLFLISGICGLLYFPIWLGSILRTFKMSDPTFSCLVVASACLGIYRLWEKRNQVAEFTASVQSKYLGCLLILPGIVASLMDYRSISLRAMCWASILVGLALFLWGVKFFQAFPVEAFLILLSTHPGPNVIISGLWSRAFGSQTEVFTASASTIILKVFGYQSSVHDRVISLTNTDISVGYACSGIDAALTLGITGFLAGIYLKQNSGQILKWVLIGLFMAIFVNAIRIALVSIAANEGGQAIFDFWHSGQGSQIFSILLFTLYSCVIFGLTSSRKNISQSTSN
jgi:exosortase